MKRGLTLIEVLASIVILTMLSVTCVPLLRDAYGATVSAESIDLLELSRLADAVIEDPAAHGIEVLEEVQQMEMPWSDETTLVPVHLVRLEARAIDDENPPDHVWLVFRVGGNEVVRYVAIDPDQERRP